MTKEELLEDVRGGNIVKIYTESNETFEGEIVDLGESGLKITLLNTNKFKRIMYGRITEYDIEDAEEVAIIISKPNVDDTVEDIEKGNTLDVITEIEQNDTGAEKIEASKENQYDQKNIFGELDTVFNLESIREMWISKFYSVFHLMSSIFSVKYAAWSSASSDSLK